MSNNNQYKYDKLQMYFGEPYVIDLEDIKGSVTVLQPTIGDIIKVGEDRFYSTLNTFITNSTQYRLVLWEQGIDWTTISDFDLFCMLYKNIDKTISDLLFVDIDFNNFVLSQKSGEDGNVEVVLYDYENNIEINKEVHSRFSQYLRNVFKIFPDEVNTDSKMLKEWYITKDKRDLAHKEKMKKKESEEHLSQLQAMISACVNHPGFKYKLQELREVHVCEFYDSVQRLQVYESSTALMKGMYSGFVDGKKIKPKDYNFMRTLELD